MADFSKCMTGTCADCGNPIAEWNQSGYCKDCYDRNRPYRPRNKEYDAGWRRRRPEVVTCRNARHRAKVENLPCDITPESIPPIPARCVCCEKLLVHGGEWHEQPSLDKIVPKRGYVNGNVAWICRRCNQVKGNATLEELRAVVDYLEVLSLGC